MGRFGGGGEGRGMPFALMDDKFWAHPKLVRVGNEAAAVYLRSIGYAADQLTDGEVPRAIALLLCGDAESCARVSALLVAHRLWEMRGDDFAVHDYLDWNRSAKEWKLLK